MTPAGWDVRHLEGRSTAGWIFVTVAALCASLAVFTPTSAEAEVRYDARGYTATTPRIATSGSTASARFALLARRTSRLRAVVLRVRDAQGRKFDFVRKTGVRVSNRFSGLRRGLPGGSYRAWVAYSRNGSRWWKASGVKRFTVRRPEVPSVSLDDLTTEVSGDTVTARYSITTTRPVSFAPIVVATRDEQGRIVDFGHETATVDGKRTFNAARSLPPGTYTSWVAYTLDGSRWVDLTPRKTYTISGSGTPPPDPTPAPEPSPDPGTSITPPAGGPWTLAFHDEFNDDTLDTSKWDWKYARSGDMIYSNWNNGEAQWYKRENLEESNGALNVIAKREWTTSPYSGRTFEYTSGLIHSKPSFNFRYGYMEARMWLPKGSGFWPAFWTWSSNEQWPPEIDAMEFYGDNPTLTYLTYHGSAGADGTRISSSDWTTGWHTFAVDWEPGRLTWYIDGVARKTVNASPDLDMYLIANLAIANGQRAPAPNSSTPFPSALKIDYIRAWKRG